MNKPTLFVNSIIVDINGDENQTVYDSRKHTKNKIFHRLDDIFCFLKIGKRVFVEILYLDKFFYGEVMKFDNQNLFLKVNGEQILYPIVNLSDIKIKIIT